MPWYFYLAVKQLFPTGKFPFFTAISVLGVSLGVAVLVIVTSVMGGFGYEIRRMIVQTEGEIQVKASEPGGLLEDPADAMARVRQNPAVAGATPYVNAPVAALAENATAFPIFRGIDLDTIEDVAELDRFTEGGRIADLDDDSVILSKLVARQLGARLGDEIEIVSPVFIQRMRRDEIYLPRAFRVVGYFEIGHHHIDSVTIYGTVRAARELYDLGPAVHGLNLRLKPGASEPLVVAQLNQALPKTLRASSWMENWESFLYVLNLEKTINFFLLLFIVIIAAFSVMSSLLISVVRKTREIGLLGALGASRRTIALCFCTQAFLIGVTGTAVGVALGFGVLAIRNDIVLGLARLFNREDTLRQFYQLSQLPRHTLASDLVMTIVAAIAISTLAGLLPAWRAARLKPVEALRSE